MKLHILELFRENSPSPLLVIIPLFTLYISEGKIIKTKLLTQSKAKRLFQQQGGRRSLGT